MDLPQGIFSHAISSIAISSIIWCRIVPQRRDDLLFHHLFTVSILQKEPLASPARNSYGAFLTVRMPIYAGAFTFLLLHDLALNQIAGMSANPVPLPQPHLFFSLVVKSQVLDHALVPLLFAAFARQ